jgi:hypothetical protein
MADNCLWFQDKNVPTRVEDADGECLAMFECREDAATAVREHNAHGSLVTKLKEMQFSDWRLLRGSVCPACGRSEAQGHSPDCGLDTVIRLAETGEV